MDLQSYNLNLYTIFNWPVFNEQFLSVVQTFFAQEIPILYLYNLWEIQNTVAFPYFDTVFILGGNNLGDDMNFYDSLIKRYEGSFKVLL